MASPPPYVATQQEPSHSRTRPIEEMPPPYSAVNNSFVPEGLPPYEENSKPPTYNEVEAMHRQNVIREIFNLSDDELEISDRSLEHNIGRNSTDTELNLGSNTSFLACFFLSFILNWIGLLIGYCLGGSYAAQCGSLAGFGFSLIKWAILIKHSNCCLNTMVDHPWVMWLFIVSGLVLSLKGVMSFAKRKRSQQGDANACAFNTL